MPDFNPDEYLSADFNPDSYLGAIPESANNIDVPAGGAGQAFAERPQQPERSMGDVAEGVGETALSLGTGMTGGALGFGAGTVGGIIGELTGMLKPGEGLELAQKLGSMLTYEPRGEAGKEYVGDIGETLGVLPPVGLTGGVTPKFGAHRSELGQKMLESSNERIQKSFKKKSGDTVLSQMYGKSIKEAVKQGFDERTMNMLADLSPVDNRAARKMVAITEKGMKDLEFQQRVRPADAVGDSFLKQVNYVRAENKHAGKQLGQVAKRLEGKGIDVSEPIDNFYNSLEKIGVKLDEDGKLNFEGSRIRTVAPARKIINDVYDELRINPSTDALKAHEFKGFLDENINFGKKQEGLSGKAEKIVGDLRKGINKSIGDEYGEYKEANKRFSDTISAIQKLEDVVGKKLNMDGPNADKAFGVELNSLMSNRKGRANLMDAVDGIEQTAHSYGGSFNDNILRQMLVADELEIAFGGTGRKTLKGQVKGGVVDAGVDLAQMSVIGAAAKGAKYLNEKRLGINKKNQMKAIKKLLATK